VQPPARGGAVRREKQLRAEKNQTPPEKPLPDVFLASRVVSRGAGVSSHAVATRAD